MSRRQLESIRRVLEARKQEVPLTGVWKDISQTLGVGRIVGRKLYLSEGDLKTLAVQFRSMTGGLGHELDLDTDRVTMASVVADEKLARRSAFSRYVRMAHSDGEMTFIGPDGSMTKSWLPPASYIGVCEEALPVLSPGTCDRVLVIENGAIMECLQQLVPLLPDRYSQRAFYVYRGNGEDGKIVNRLIEGLDPEIEVACLPDFDPSGLFLAITQFANRARGAFSLLVPENPEALIPWSKPTSFAMQEAHLNSLTTLVMNNDELKEIVSRLRDHQVAVTQEAMLAHKAMFRRIQIKPDVSPPPLLN